MRGFGRFPIEYERVKKPDSIKDIPRYLKELLGGFFSRYGYIVKLVWKSGPWILFLLSVIAVIKGIIPVMGSIISKNILNALQEVIKIGPTSANDFYSSGIMFLLIFLFVYWVLARVINYVSHAVNRIAGEKVVKQVRIQIMEKSKQIDLASFDKPAFYEKMENANREAGMRPLSILSETFNMISSIIEFTSYLVILLTAPALRMATLIILLVSVPSAAINFVYRKKNFKYMRFHSKERRQMNYYSDVLVNKDLIKEVKIYDLADTFIGHYKNVFAKYYKGLRNLIVSESAWHIAVGVVSGLINLVFYVIIAKKVFTGEMMIGDYSLYTGAITSIAGCVGTLIATSATIYEGTLFIDNLITFMKEKQTIVPNTEIPAAVEKNVGHTIEFKNVSFKYPGTEKYVLKNINLTINAGQTVVLVGLNGAGKTTLIKLITRLYDPTEGEIFLDGKNVKEYDISSLYSMFSIIFQDFGKYAFTVEENIRFGDIHKEAEYDEIVSAAEKSSSKGYIDKLERGFNTPLTRFFEPDGLELSIGQWQKLAIARAFYSDSDILILDEPTASLDPIAEQEIYNQFDSLRENKTTVFVSHRLSSATVADNIFVLENGELIESGNHQKLMEQKGKYYEFFTTQAKRYISK